MNLKHIGPSLLTVNLFFTKKIFILIFSLKNWIFSPSQILSHCGFIVSGQTCPFHVWCKVKRQLPILPNSEINETCIIHIFRILKVFMLFYNCLQYSFIEACWHIGMSSASGSEDSWFKPSWRKNIYWFRNDAGSLEFQINTTLFMYIFC